MRQRSTSRRNYDRSQAPDSSVSTRAQTGSLLHITEEFGRIEPELWAGKRVAATPRTLGGKSCRRRDTRSTFHGYHTATSGSAVLGFRFVRRITSF